MLPSSFSPHKQSRSSSHFANSFQLISSLGQQHFFFCSAFVWHFNCAERIPQKMKCNWQWRLPWWNIIARKSTVKNGYRIFEYLNRILAFVCTKNLWVVTFPATKWICTNISSHSSASTPSIESCLNVRKAERAKLFITSNIL